MKLSFFVLVGGAAIAAFSYLSQSGPLGVESTDDPAPGGAEPVPGDPDFVGPVQPSQQLPTANALVAVWREAIAHMEGFYKDGSTAQRNNNPGNIRGGDGAFIE